MIIDTEAIKKIVYGEIAAYTIERETGVSRNTISRIRSEKSSMDNLPLASLKKLQLYINQLEENNMENLEIYSTYEGNTKDLVDIEIQNGEIVEGVPYFDKSGAEITYDEALELYGFDGLSQDIWDDEKYLSHIKTWIQGN